MRYLLINLIILLPALTMIAAYTKEYIIVDMCLDAGGSYNYMAGLLIQCYRLMKGIHSYTWLVFCRG